MGLLDNIKDGFDKLGDTLQQGQKDMTAKREAQQADAAQQQADDLARKAEEAKANAEQQRGEAVDAARAAETPAEREARERQEQGAAEARAEEVRHAQEKAAAERAEREAAQRAEHEQQAAADGAQHVDQAAEAPQERTYTVVEGDTLSSIGEQFSVSYESIAQLNGIENPDLIFPGQVFRIPNA